VFHAESRAIALQIDDPAGGQFFIRPQHLGFSSVPGQIVVWTLTTESAGFVLGLMLPTINECYHEGRHHPPDDGNACSSSLLAEKTAVISSGQQCRHEIATQDCADMLLACTPNDVTANIHPVHQLARAACPGQPPAMSSNASCSTSPHTNVATLSLASNRPPMGSFLHLGAVAPHVAATPFLQTRASLCTSRPAAYSGVHNPSDPIKRSRP